jgi:hypothetical protein
VSSYVGKAGQLAVMAELALRGYNVAIPEIDIGDDVFVLNDRTKEAARIQVKTSTGKRARTRFDCRFSVNVPHVQTQGIPGNYYALVGRCGERWRFVVVPTSKLAWLLFVRRPKWGSIRADQSEAIVGVTFLDSGKAKSHSKANAINLTKYQEWCLGLGRE